MHTELFIHQTNRQAASKEAKTNVTNRIYLMKL